MLSRGVSYVETNDLSGAYADAAGPVVKLQIAKQGYRCVRSILAGGGPTPDLLTTQEPGSQGGWTRSLLLSELWLSITGSL